MGPPALDDDGAVAQLAHEKRIRLGLPRPRRCRLPSCAPVAARAELLKTELPTMTGPKSGYRIRPGERVRGLPRDGECVGRGAILQHRSVGHHSVDERAAWSRSQHGVDVDVVLEWSQCRGRARDPPHQVHAADHVNRTRYAQRPLESPGLRYGRPIADNVRAASAPANPAADCRDRKRRYTAPHRCQRAATCYRC